ncbi:adenylyltransferase/cytidyltransferase family protein [Candidatus Roizmanbacteria bacterium]|nr:adenylyltransferase/cytidyltransferase family protein [Candidatus Roizmanbacteria bacterium]
MKKTALIIPYSRIDSYKKLLKDKKTVLVGGCFDLLHFGHLQFLKKAKVLGNYLIVVLESDEFIKKNKRESPIHSQKERAEVLSAINVVDLVVNLPYFSSNKEYSDMVKTINPNIVAVTEGDPQLNNKRKQIEEIGGKLKIVTPLLKKFSTRKIVSVFN